MLYSQPKTPRKDQKSYEQNWEGNGTPVRDRLIENRIDADGSTAAHINSRAHWRENKKNRAVCVTHTAFFLCD